MPSPRDASFRDQREQPLRLDGRERGRRLVEEQDAGIERHRLGDLDHLPDRYRRLGQAVCRTSSAMPSSASSASASRLSRGQSTSPNRVGARPAKMFSPMLTVSVSDSSWKTVAMPSICACFGEAMDDRPRPPRRISPASGCDHAGEDVHQRRFAGAVLADQRVHLAARPARTTRRRAPASRRSSC